MKKKTMLAGLILALFFLSATSVSSAETVRFRTGRHRQQAIHTEYDHFCHNQITSTQPQIKEQTNPTIPAANPETTNQQVEAHHNPIVTETISETPQMNSQVNSWHTENQHNTQGPGNGQHGNRGQGGNNHQGGGVHRNGH